MKKYVWVFILSRQTLASVSYSRPTIGTIVKKNIPFTPFTLAQSICTIVENQQQKFEHLSEVKEDLKNDYPVNIKSNGIKKALKFLKINLGNQKKNKHEVLPFYCYTE